MPCKVFLLDRVAQAHFLSTQYLTKVFWQITLRREDREKNGLFLPLGFVYQFTKMRTSWGDSHFSAPDGWGVTVSDELCLSLYWWHHQLWQFMGGWVASLTKSVLWYSCKNWEMGGGGWRGLILAIPKRAPFGLAQVLTCLPEVLVWSARSRQLKQLVAAQTGFEGAPLCWEALYNSGRRPEAMPMPAVKGITWRATCEQ